MRETFESAHTWHTHAIPTITTHAYTGDADRPSNLKGLFPLKRLSTLTFQDCLEYFNFRGLLVAHCRFSIP